MSIIKSIIAERYDFFNWLPGNLALDRQCNSIAIMKSPTYSKKDKVFYCQEPPVENLLPQNVGSIINYSLQSAKAAQWGTPSCSQPQSATDNGVRGSRSN